MSHTPTLLTIQGRPSNEGMPNGFDERLANEQHTPLTGLSIGTVQANIGLVCNLACHHCHVESSPKRNEAMSWQTMRDVLDATNKAGAHTLDITGGAPEMHEHFAAFVDAAREQDLHVMVRTNLTIMLQEGYQHLPEFCAKRRIHLVASLPCYLQTNVDKQRGKHVYHDSIDVIQQLNRVGYGTDDTLQLDLVYNPGGPSLPPDQTQLEAAYKTELDKRFGIQFNKLYTITNIPIGRFLHDLERDGKADGYLEKLQNAFNTDTLDGLMCRHQIHIGWDGTVYDCDFNYALGLPADVDRQHLHIRDFDPTTFAARRIATDNHCFACTAGCGSSCGGSLV